MTTTTTTKTTSVIPAAEADSCARDCALSHHSFETLTDIDYEINATDHNSIHLCIQNSLHAIVYNSNPECQLLIMPHP